MQLPTLENIPEKRMMHDGGVYGCIYLSYGGINKEKIVLDDLNLYDLEALTWIKMEQTNKERNSHIGPRFWHTLTACLPDMPPPPTGK